MRRGDNMVQLWGIAGHETDFAFVLDQLFYNSRNAHLSIWPSSYPTEELVDDISVFRPLELFNECNKFKYRLVSMADRSPLSVGEKQMAQELRNIGNVRRTPDPSQPHRKFLS
jgi:hypothetical protein